MGGAGAAAPASGRRPPSGGGGWLNQLRFLLLPAVDCESRELGLVACGLWQFHRKVCRGAMVQLASLGLEQMICVEHTVMSQIRIVTICLIVGATAAGQMRGPEGSLPL